MVTLQCRTRVFTSMPHVWLVELEAPDYPGERLIVWRNPFLAAERAPKRETLLAASAKQLEAIAAAATKRTRQPLHGKEQIGMRIGAVINRYKVAQHFVVEISGERPTYRRKERKIAAEAAPDRLYVVRTSVAVERAGFRRAGGTRSCASLHVCILHYAERHMCE